MAYPSDEELSAAGVRIEVAGPVLTVVLARPDVRNAQTPAMWRALAAVGAGRSDDVRVVVLRGEGSCFSAGLDRAMMTPDGVPGDTSLLQLVSGSDADMDAAIEVYQQGFTWWRDPDIVSIAAVHGPAVGAGFQLALACDLRILADTARLCMKESALGLVPDLAGTKPLVDIVGYSRALEICATARWVNAHEARELGIATAVVPEKQLPGTVEDLVAALLSSDAEAVRGTKRLLQAAAGRMFDEQRTAERQEQIARLRDLQRAMSDA